MLIFRLIGRLAGWIARCIRMAVARVYDRVYPESCWANSAAWALGYEGTRLGRTSTCPDARSSPTGCWCGKFRSEVFDRKQPAF